MQSKLHSQLQQPEKQKTNTMVFVLSVLILILLCVAFVVNTWNISIRETEREAIQLAEAAEAGIPKFLLLKLSADSSDIHREEYKEIKHALTSISHLDNNIRFAYIIIKKAGKIYFLADSEPTDSVDYSFPGQEFTEASEEYYRPFSNGQTRLTEPTSDRWGKWISVLVPMKHIQTGEILAVFAVDYPAESWNQQAIARTIQAGFVAVCVLAIFAVLYIAFAQNRELRREKKKLIDSESKLQESETLFRTVFDQATIGISIGNNEKYIAFSSNNRPGINPMFEKITGRTKEELISIGWVGITSPEDLPADLEKFEKFKAGEINGYDMEKRYIKPDGSKVWVHMSISPLHLENTEDCNFLCLIKDISKQKEIEKSLYDSERSKAVLLDNLPGMAYRCNYDREWTMQFVSRGCFELTGYNSESLLNNKEISFNDLISLKYQEYLWNKWVEILEARSKLKEEYEIITAYGEVKWVFEQGQGIFDENGNVIALEGLIIDITERKEQEIKLKYISEHDTLTGLHNRRYFEELLNQELDSNIENKRAVILVNLRKFSLVSITYGYLYSENLIKHLADKLSSLRTNDRNLFHISLDRFAFYVSNYKDRMELAELCDLIIEILDTSLSMNNIKGSLGIVEIEDYKCDADSILKFASIAAEHARETQTRGYCYFDREMEETILRKEAIKSELAKAGKDKQDGLYLEYQPIIDLKTDNIRGFEALARFRSEKLGLVSPVEFIPIAEETQLIVPLGRKIMRLAFGFLKRLETEGHHNITMSFNISAIQLLRDDFLPDLIEIINEIKSAPSNLNIEITESVFLNNYQDINVKLEKIKELGIKVSIDDFGTDYSSLARVRELNISCLKIDKYFIDKLLILDPQEAITGDIISMAHKLGHFVVAEGVEFEKQKQYLIEHNCDYMQGYLFSKPLSQEAAIELLRKTGKMTAGNVVVMPFIDKV